jgi:hypothetical protein
MYPGYKFTQLHCRHFGVQYFYVTENGLCSQSQDAIVT